MAEAEKEIVTLYNGEVQIAFYPNSHQYRIPGQKTTIISVTGATGMLDKSRPLLIWATGLARDFMIEALERGEKITHELISQACMQHEVKKEEAASIGDMAHGFMEEFVRSKIHGEPAPQIDDSWPDEVVNCVNGFLDWYNANEVRFLASEQIVFSREHEFVGKYDFKAIVNGKLSIVDGKSSSGIYPEYRYQVSGYSIADFEEHGQPIEQHIILKFGKKDGVFDTLCITDSEEMNLDKQAFLAALTLKRRDKVVNKWRG